MKKYLELFPDSVLSYGKYTKLNGLELYPIEIAMINRDLPMIEILSKNIPKELSQDRLLSHLNKKHSEAKNIISEVAAVGILHMPDTIIKRYFLETENLSTILSSNKNIQIPQEVLDKYSSEKEDFLQKIKTTIQNAYNRESKEEKDEKSEEKAMNNKIKTKNRSVKDTLDLAESPSTALKPKKVNELAKKDRTIDALDLERG